MVLSATGDKQVTKLSASDVKVTAIENETKHERMMDG